MKAFPADPHRPAVAAAPVRTTARSRLAAGCLVLAAVLAGCASSGNKAPVEDRGARGRPPAAGAAVPSPTDGAALPGAENAGKPGYYTVKPGDTLIRIGLENGQNWRDVARWNNIENANLIEVGQVLRVLPPGADAATAARGVAAPGRVDPRPLDARPPTAASAAAVTGGAASAPPVAAVPPVPAPAPPRDPDDDIPWAWPAAGPVASGFDESRSKGLAITGKLGDPVLAAADGRVVYAGSGLRGYGNLVIVKHNATYLTAYAHNQTLLVKEDQAVRRGQKIAEMGSSDAERVQLHFEIRRQGKPVDPAKLLPPR
jgi:lipoprotein NlpD